MFDISIFGHAGEILDASLNKVNADSVNTDSKLFNFRYNQHIPIKVFLIPRLKTRLRSNDDRVLITCL